MIASITELSQMSSTSFISPLYMRNIEFKNLLISNDIETARCRNRLFLKDIRSLAYAIYPKAAYAIMLFRIPDNIIVIAIPYKPIRAYLIYLSTVLFFFFFTDIV